MDRANMLPIFSPVPRRVLVVGQRPAALKSVRSHLAGHAATIVPTCEEAMAILSTDPPDLVLLDVLTPCDQNLRLFRRMYQTSIPLVLYPGNDQELRQRLTAWTFTPTHTD